MILAIDPGVTTGWAVLNGGEITTGNIRTPDSLAGLIGEIACAHGTVVVENFIGGGYRTKESAETLQVLGFVRYYCAWLRVPCIVQVPQRRLPYVSQARDLLPPTSRHGVDALAHLLAYLLPSERGRLSQGMRIRQGEDNAD